jgi:hypothetical protein
MYTTLDTTTILSLARQHQDDVKRSFPRRQRRVVHPDPSTPTIITAPPGRIDVGALSIPSPRRPDRETTAA